MIFNMIFGNAAVNAVNDVKNPTITVKDIVLTNNFILRDETSGVSNVKDLNGDGVVNAMDSVLLRRELIKNNSVSLMDFSTDTSDIYVGNSAWVTFSVYAYTETPFEENQLAVYDEDDNFIAYMIDDDEDNIYTAEVELSSDKREIVSYYCAAATAKSNYDYISYYDEITDEEINNFIDVQENVAGMEFDDVAEYIKNCSKIEAYMIDMENEHIFYVADGGIPVIWEKSSKGENGSGTIGSANYSALENDFSGYSDEVGTIEADNRSIDLTQYPISTGDYSKFANDYYSAAMEIIESDDWDYVPAHSEKNNVICILPFDDANSGDNPVCRAAAQLTANALNKGDDDIHYIEYSAGSANEPSVDNLRRLFDDNSNVGAVFVQSHGMFISDEEKGEYLYYSNDGKDHTYIIEPGSSIMTSDRVYYFDDKNNVYFDNVVALKNHDKEIQSRQLCLSFHTRENADGKIFEDCYLAITPSFIDSNYESSDLEDTFWYIGSCEGLNPDGKIGTVLADKGAAVIGYSSSNTWQYNAACTMESIVNQMLLNNYPVKSAVSNTRNSAAKIDDTIVFLSNDYLASGAPKYKSDVLTYNGDGDFRLFYEKPNGTVTANISACNENNKTKFPVPIYITDGNELQNTYFKLFREVKKSSPEYWAVLIPNVNVNYGKAFQYSFNYKTNYYIITKNNSLYKEYSTYCYNEQDFKAFCNDIYSDGFAAYIEMECTVTDGNYLGCCFTTIPSITSFVDDEHYLTIAANFQLFNEYEFDKEQEYYERFTVNELNNRFINLKLHVNWADEGYGTGIGGVPGLG